MFHEVLCVINNLGIPYAKKTLDSIVTKRNANVKFKRFGQNTNKIV